jgi:hypothetical protein
MCWPEHGVATVWPIAAQTAPLGGLVGGVQVYAGLVNKVGAGPIVGMTVTSDLLSEQSRQDSH